MRTRIGWLHEYLHHKKRKEKKSKEKKKERESGFEESNTEVIEFFQK